MPSLKILDLSYTQVKKLPNSISNLKNLTALLPYYCKQLTEVPSLENLLALENLDLGFTSIPGLPEGIARLTNLRSLNLFLFAPVVLPTVMHRTHRHLRKLTIYHGSMNSEPVLTSEEAIIFNRLDSFEASFVSVYDFNTYVQSLVGQTPKRYHLVGGSGFPLTSAHYNFKSALVQPLEDENKFVGLFIVGKGEDFVMLPTDVQRLHLRCCPGISDIDDLMRGNYPDLKFLLLQNCQDLKKLVSPKFLSALQNLEVIEVEGCHKMEEMIADDDDEKEQGSSGSIIFALPKLRVMSLKSLRNLKRICGGNGILVCESLRQIHVYWCPKLERFPVSLPLPAIKEIGLQKHWWESLEWDNPNAKAFLRPFCNFLPLMTQFIHIFMER